MAALLQAVRPYSKQEEFLHYTCKKISEYYAVAIQGLTETEYLPEKNRQRRAEN